MPRPPDRVWIDADLAPLASECVKDSLARLNPPLASASMSGPLGTEAPELVRLRLLVRLLGQLHDSPGSVSPL